MSAVVPDLGEIYTWLDRRLADAAKRRNGDEVDYLLERRALVPELHESMLLLGRATP